MFDKSKYNRDFSPHPMTGHTSRLSLYDRFHENNHPKSTMRRVDNIKGCEGKVNTQAAEQANSTLKKKGWFMNELTLENYIKLVMDKLQKKKVKINMEYLLHLQRDLPSASFHQNSKGVLVCGSYEEACADNQGVYDQETENFKVLIDHPLAVLKNPDVETFDLSWFNAALYMLIYGPFL